MCRVKPLNLQLYIGEEGKVTRPAGSVNDLIHRLKPLTQSGSGGAPAAPPPEPAHVFGAFSAGLRRVLASEVARLRPQPPDAGSRR